MRVSSRVANMNLKKLDVDMSVDEAKRASRVPAFYVALDPSTLLPSVRALQCSYLCFQKDAPSIM